MAKVIDCKEPKKWAWVEGEDFELQIERGDKLFEELVKVSDKIKIGGDPVGALIKFPVADGYAHYRVVKASPLTLEHIPVENGWYADIRLLRGITTRDIWDELKSQRTLSSIFSSKKGKK